MPKNANYTSQDRDSIFLHRWKMLKTKIIKNNWNNPNKSSLKNLKIPNQRKNNVRFEYKGICLLIGILALLSIGMCIQADSLAKALRELARISVQQTIRMK